jgi:membrane protein
MKALSVARQVISEFGRVNGTILAAAIAYYTLLSIFPLILGLLAIVGMVISDPETQGKLIADVAGLFPGSEQLIQSTILEVVDGRQTAGIVATIVLIWSASGVFGGISQALDRIWKVPQSRNVVLNAVLAVGLVFAVALIFVASLVLSAGLRIAQNLNLPLLGISLGSVPFLFALIGFVVPFLLSFGIFAGIYGFVPNVHLTWQQVWPGALLASLLFEVSKQAFAWYLSSFANYNAVYGSIGAVIALATWAYYAAIVLLLGAQLNAVLSIRLPRPPAQP